MFLLISILAHLAELSFGQQPCSSRDYGNGGTVCVCNSTYCDTIPRPPRVPEPQILIYTSNQAGLRFQRTNGTFNRTFSSGPHKNSVFVNHVKEFQTILGWGGAFTDATGININSLPEELQETLLRSYFSENGTEYNLCRVPMGGTDFSVRAYSYDDGPRDPNLTNFRLAPEDFDFKIPYIRRALNLTNDSLKLIGSVWTAPRWMKTNERYSGYGFIKTDLFQTWADYFLKFLDAYQRQGINFWGVTTGNEPSDVLYFRDRLEVVGWPFWSLGRWIMDNLGPTIRNSNHSNVKIMILDDQRNFLPWYVEKALRNGAARQYIDGIAVHWYLDSEFSPQLLDMAQDRFPEMFILGTEACVMPELREPAVILGSWRRGEQYSYDIIQDMLHWVAGWVDWNMALNLEGGPNYINNFVDACIIVNPGAGEFYKQPLYYHFGHFSKFVPRGSVRVFSEVKSKTKVYGVAFRRPDNGTVVVLLNRNRRAVAINLNDGSRGIVNLELSPSSITTVLYW